MNNSRPKILESKGFDRPILKVYLAGRIAGNVIEKCIEWRLKIINHYKNYKGTGKAYPISFLDALNSKESESIDEKGLKSRIPTNLIFDKDMLSIKHADVIVANMDDFFEGDIKGILELSYQANMHSPKNIIAERLAILKDKIINRRENFGTIEEVGVAKYLGKPVILIVPEHRKELFSNHPFQSRASHIVTSVDELLEEEWLETLYKSIAGSYGNY